MNTNRRFRAGTSRRRGLTLVELLVGVACLAILVPLLAAADDAATRPNRERMCAFRLGRLGTAMLQYTVDNDGYLPGSPGTSGTQIIYEYPGAPDTAVDIPIALTQSWDWAGPLTPYVGITPDPNRARRVEQYRQGDFWCPSNDRLSYPFANGAVGPVGEWQPIRMGSYLAMRNLMFFGREAPPSPNVANWDHAMGVTNPTDFPASYYPRMSQFAAASDKSFLSDGSRFTNRDTGQVDHDIAPVGTVGGMYADGGPTQARVYLRSYFLDSPLREYAYRHSHGETPGINVVFFDGHVSWMSEATSRQPRWWWPTGTILPIEELNSKSRVAVLPDLVNGRDYHVP